MKKSKDLTNNHVLEGGTLYTPASEPTSEPTSESVQEFLTSLRDTHHIYDFKIQ